MSIAELVNLQEERGEHAGQLEIKASVTVNPHRLRYRIVQCMKSLGLTDKLKDKRLIIL